MSFWKKVNLFLSVSAEHGGSWEFYKCLFYTYMHYQEGKFYLLSYIMDSNHAEPQFLNSMGSCSCPWNPISQQSISVNFTHIHPALGALAPSPAKQIFHLNLRLLHLSILCCYGIQGHVHYCGLKVIWWDEHLIRSHLICFRSRDVFLKGLRLSDTFGLYLNNQHFSLSPSLGS